MYHAMTPPGYLNVLLPFGGFKERYEICSPSIGFRGFVLATPSDFDIIKYNCNFGAGFYLIVLDPYDEYYTVVDNVTALPPVKTRIALRYDSYQFAPGEVYINGYEGAIIIDQKPSWTLYDFYKFPQEYNFEDNRFGKIYDREKCALWKSKKNLSSSLHKC